MVRIDTLTDVDPAYRTLAVSDNGQRATYTLESPEHRWQLNESVGFGGYPLGFWVTGLALIVVVVPAANYALIRNLRAGPAEPSR